MQVSPDDQNLVMESILSSFHLDITSFSELLHATNAIVAGSAALAAYMSERSSDAFQPNDLDIWVRSDFFPCADATLPDHPAVAVRNSHQFLFAYFLTQHGYSEVHRPFQSDAEYASNPVFSILRNIQRFRHKSGCIIQVMHCNVVTDAILDTFDLSVAKTWWVPSLHPNFRHGFLHTFDSIALKAGEMYSLREATTEREKDRIQKYEKRGFRLVHTTLPELHACPQQSQM